MWVCDKRGTGGQAFEKAIAHHTGVLMFFRRKRKAYTRLIERVDSAKTIEGK